ncbi:MAG: protein kinase [Burkholderiales bacterium]|nr:protein kinase [Burkholderiales bacterium]
MEHIGKYTVRQRLGDGATSEVYLCHDPFNDREVAVKVVHHSSAGDAAHGRIAKRLFVSEASLAGKLDHPHIVHIYDAVETEEMSYIVMEYVTGGTLEPYCSPGRLLPVERVVEIIFKCTRALQYAGRMGITHRDIKPANLLLADETTVKISDFGAALMEAADRTQVSGIGSPAYMSPQQIKEQVLNHQTDIYSLGVVMYQLLTGQLPFSASNNFAMMYQITSVEPPPPSSCRPEIPASLDRIVRRAMEKELEVRYQTWDEFSNELADAFRSGALASPARDVPDAEKFETLRGLSLFAEFSDTDLWEVTRLSRWENCPAGVTLMREGDIGDFFCVLAAGEVKVTKRKKLLNLLTPGECFGEMAYLSRGGKERSADVTTVTEARVIRIATEALDQASESCRHRFDRAFIGILVERLTLANTRLTAV